jgi:hypothetical protein
MAALPWEVMDMPQMGTAHLRRCVNFKLLVASLCKRVMRSKRERNLVGVTPKATIIPDD